MQEKKYKNANEALLARIVNPTKRTTQLVWFDPILKPNTPTAVALIYFLDREKGQKKKN